MTRETLMIPSQSREARQIKRDLLPKLGMEVSRIFSGAGQPIETRFIAMLDAGCAAFDTDYGHIALRDGARVITSDASKNQEDNACLDGKGSLTEWMLAHRLPLTINGAARRLSGPAPVAEDAGPQRFIGAPILFDGQVFGTIAFFSGHAGPEPFDEMDIAMIQMLCVIIAAPTLLLASS